MGVYGFRFDLAPSLVRQDGEFEARSAFFDLVSQDPVVSQAKLIAGRVLVLDDLHRLRNL